MTDHDASFDFVLHAAAPLAGLARAYGFDVDAAATDLADRELSVGGLLARRFGVGVRVGDRAPWGPVELVVRTLRGGGQVETVGLALAPSTGSRTPRS